MGIGDWGLGIGALGFWAGPTPPHPQTPTPNPPTHPPRKVKKKKKLF